MALSGGTWVWWDYVGIAGSLGYDSDFLVKSRREMFILAAHALLVLTLRGENKGISPRTTRASATDNGENR